MADYDGDLSNVNPDLLKLCANAEDWREQRRRAMKAKIFGGGTADGTASASASAYLPSDTSASPPTHAPASSIPASQQASEAYILQQILSHKRRRDEANGQTSATASASGVDATHDAQQGHQAQQQAPSGDGELSLKEKLLRKYNRN